MGIVIPAFLVVISCLWIWRACDGFEVASEYLGRNMTEGVRGGTINAISSSLPELLTTAIGLLLLNDTEGFSMGIGTTAGSALFNGMIIPAVCILVVVGRAVRGKRVDSVDVATRVLRRDGLTLIACEVVLIVILAGRQLHWWQGLVLMCLYLSYLVYMLLSMKRADETDDEDGEEREGSDPPMTGVVAIIVKTLTLGPILDLESTFVRDKEREQIKAGTWNAWPLLLAAVAAIGASCLVLVRACEWLGSGPGNASHQSYFLFGREFSGINMPTMFVAVIFASMATSVPDTIMSLRDARDGDYDDAVANALGSNIFDICFALGLPLFLYTLIYGPIEMDTATADQSTELRLLLVSFTICGFLTYYVGKRHTLEDGTRVVRMGRIRGLILLVLYSMFVAYIIGRSQQAAWAMSISEFIHEIAAQLPAVG